MSMAMRSVEKIDPNTVGLELIKTDEDMCQLAAGTLEAAGVSVEPVVIDRATPKGYERPDLIEKNQKLVALINERYKLPRFTNNPEHDVSFKNKGACKGMDPALFTSKSGEKAKSAKAACNNYCAVKEECLEYALKANVSGIWGGTNGRDRELIRKQRRIEAQAEEATTTKNG